MAKKKTASAEPARALTPARAQSSELARPSFMQQDALAGTEDLQQFIRPPRLKVVQKSSGKPFSDMFNVGDVIAVPQQIMVAPVQLLPNGKPDEQGEPFHFAPVFFYPEWCLWNPIELKGQQNAIRARTCDPRDPLAAKCRDPRLWFEECPELPEKKMRYVEHLNYIIVLLGQHELAGMPMILSFFRGSYMRGSNFATLLKLRKAPIFGCQFEAWTQFETNAKGDWYGIQVANPSIDNEAGIGPFCDDEERYETLKAMHLDLKDAHAKGILQADYEDVEAEDTSDVEY